MKNFYGITLIIILTLSFAGLSKAYYVKQKLTGFDPAGKNMENIQETYVSDDIVVIIDEVSKQIVDDSTYTFYNLADSTFFQKKFSEMNEISNYANSQIQEFTLTPTEKKEKIGKWNTQLYKAKAKVMGMEMDLQMNISDETGLPPGILYKHQERMQGGAQNIMDMMKKIKNTGGMVVKETATVGGRVVSEKLVTAAAIIKKIDESIKSRPEGFTEMKK